MSDRAATMMARIGRGLIGALLLLGAPQGAAAHAFLDHARPAVGAVLAAPPDSMQLWFTQPLEPAFDGDFGFTVGR